MASRRSVAKYTYRIEFRAPLDFVYRWCTDYRSDDARREGESYQRKIIERGPRQVVYEDLEDSKDGWFWSRHVVRLDPPDHWHSDSVGNRRQYALDYRLRETGPLSTELNFTARRKQLMLGGPNPPPDRFQKMMDSSWHPFRRELEREYRQSARSRRRRGRGRRA